MSIPAGPRPRHPGLAAALSFFFPGLGQAYAGQLRVALLLAAPVVAVIGAASVAYAIDPDGLRNQLFSSAFLWAIIGLDLGLLLWRVGAIGHAWWKTDVPEPRIRPPEREGPARDAAASPAERFPLARARLVTERLRRSPLTLGLVTVMVVATVAMHAYIAVLAGTLNATLGSVFSDVPSAPAPPGGGGTAVEGPSINIPAYHWDGTERINFLLIGVDYGEGRETALDDTILVASVDPVDRRAVLISIPRDTALVPLPDETLYLGGLYPYRINELASEARASPEVWCPDLPLDADCGLRTLERTVGLYLGIPIHHYARVDLDGFSSLIDALGGVEVCLPGNLVDPEYSGPTWEGRGIVLEAGCHRLDGARALAYARIRKGWLELPNGEIEYQNDFERAARQQEILLALRREIAEIHPLELPSVIGAIGETVSTDFPRSRAGDLASLIPLITRSDVEQVVLGYPTYVDPPLDESSYYVLYPKRDAIRNKMLALFGDEGPLQGWYLGTDADAPPPADAPSAVSPGRLGGHTVWARLTSRG